LARIILIRQCIKTSENLAKHFNIITWRWCHIWCIKNDAYIQTDVNKSFSKGKNMTLQLNC